VRFFLSQKGEYTLLNYLAALSVGSAVKSYSGYNLIIELTKLSLIMEYFERFPLYTAKKQSLTKWLILYRMVKAREHKSASKLEYKPIFS
jgi:hypothetical protein